MYVLPVSSRPPHENIDARQHLIDMCPDAAVLLVERSFSTDDLEMEFSMVTRRCGKTPKMRVMIGSLNNIDRLAEIRRDCDRGFALASSAKSKYTQSADFLFAHAPMRAHMPRVPCHAAACCMFGKACCMRHAACGMLSESHS